VERTKRLRDGLKSDGQPSYWRNADVFAMKSAKKGGESPLPLDQTSLGEGQVVLARDNEVVEHAHVDQR